MKKRSLFREPWHPITSTRPIVGRTIVLIDEYGIKTKGTFDGKSYKPYGNYIEWRYQSEHDRDN